MSNFYAAYAPVSSSTAGVSSLNGETGALTLVAGTNITITPSGTNITIDAAGGGANDTLSNLSSPTAVNQTLVMDAGKTVHLDYSTPILARNNTDTADVPLIQTNGNDDQVIVASPTTTGIAVSIGTGFIDLYTTGNVGSIEMDVASLFLIADGGGTAAQLQLYDGTSTNYAAIAAPNSALADVYVLTLPVDVGTSGQVLSTDGNNPAQLAWIDAALADLSNLTSPTAINQDLLFDNSANRIIATAHVAGQTKDLYVQTGNSSGGDSGVFFAGSGDASGTSGTAFFGTGNGLGSDSSTGGVRILPGTPTGTGTPGDVEITTPDTSGTGGVSGIVIQAGQNTDAGTGGSIDIKVRQTGVIKLNDGSGTITAGQIWVATDSSGAGAWTEGATGSFTSQDGKTITVTKGLITSIV